ncbi:hypothetical protein [Thalassotalea maritima]|uniref:hypothetical protein n=1 Tax=Thalassotalea maritima TaxID=3242416 RepID=UPI00352916F0
MSSALNKLNITIGKDMFALSPLPMLTVYDDNFFLANDYDILSLGQRRHVQRHLTEQGYKQATGKTMHNKGATAVFPKPNHILAQSNFRPEFITPQDHTIYIVTPTCFAEGLFYYFNNQRQTLLLKALQQLIDRCPFNIEYLRCVTLNSNIEGQVKSLTPQLSEYQQQVIARKFKQKRAY